MLYLDIIIIITAFWFSYKGFKRGLIMSLATLIALGLGIWGCIHFSYFLGDYLSQVFNFSERMLTIASFSLTFIVILLAVRGIAKLIEHFLRMIALGFLNRLAGALFSLAKFLLILGVLFSFIDDINTSTEIIKKDQLEESYLYMPILKMSKIFYPKLKYISLNNPLK